MGNVLFSHHAIAQAKEGEVPKIAYVDQDALRLGYKAMLESHKTHKTVWDKETAKLKREIETKSESANELNSKSPEDAKAKAVEEELTTLKNAYQQKIQDLRKQQIEQLQQFEADIQASISEVVTEGQYVELRTLFKNTQACDGVDITPLVLKKLNK